MQDIRQVQHNRCSANNFDCIANFGFANIGWCEHGCNDLYILYSNRDGRPCHDGLPVLLVRWLRS